jgi:hypothetical protein
MPRDREIAAALPLFRPKPAAGKNCPRARSGIVVDARSVKPCRRFFSSTASRTDVERLDQATPVVVSIPAHYGGVAVRAQRGENG